MVPLMSGGVSKEVNLSKTIEKGTTVVERIVFLGEDADRTAYSESLPDEDDRVFYEVALSTEDAYLVTGNLKHFPKTPIVVTPAQMLDILNL